MEPNGRRSEPPARDLVGEARVQLALADMEGYEEAVALLREAIDADPACAAAHAALAEACSYWGFRCEVGGGDGGELHRMAYEHGETALRLGPERADAHRAMAVALRRGDRANPARRLEEAMIALDLDPLDAESWLEYWRASGYDPDDDAIRRALELRPGLPAARIDLAAALVERGRLDDAAAQLVLALKLAPRNALAHYDLAMVLDRLAQEGPALAILARGRALHPGDPLLEGGAALLEGR